MEPHLHLLEINIFFTKLCHCQTYQNYEQPPQRLQILTFFSIKNQRNLSEFFCEEYLTSFWFMSFEQGVEFRNWC